MSPDFLMCRRIGYHIAWRTQVAGTLQLADIGTFGIITATFVGPIAAVLVTRWVDRLRDKERRRLDIFRILMRTRKIPLNAEHVGAINLVAIEFSSETAVMAALLALIQHFEVGFGTNKTLDELKAASDKADLLRTKLLSAMAISLGYTIEQMEIHSGGYTPQGWVTELEEQARSRKALLELLSGVRALPITVAPPTANALAKSSHEQELSPFPPKPN